MLWKNNSIYLDWYMEATGKHTEIQKAREVNLHLVETGSDGRGPSITSQERQEPRHKHPKPNQERLGQWRKRLGHGRSV